MQLVMISKLVGELMARPKKPKLKPQPKAFLQGKTRIFQAPRGTYDILPDQQIWWEKVYKIVKEIAEAYGFTRIDTPILEDADLFIKGTGRETDIVEKEMYTLRTKGGDKLALRPEFTPSVMRAYLENGMNSLPQPVKLYSLGPIFRYEKPQKGRYRQHQQMNFEIIGSQEPVSDVQIIQLFFVIFKNLNLKGINLQINSIGCPKCRPTYKKLLLNYYRNKISRICPICQRRLKRNPLRLLDCKEDKCFRIASGAPQTIDHLCEECHNHFKDVLEFLDELEVSYFLNPLLVRGLDYYTKTVFEFWPESKTGEFFDGLEQEGRQSSLGGGGRYDDLIQALGGKRTPAVGGAGGLERIIEQMKSQAKRIFLPATPQIFLVQLGNLAKKKSLKLFEELRQAGLRSAESFSKDSIKSQLKLADKLGVKIALILGQQEVLDGTVIIRDMSSGIQEIVPQNKLISQLKKKLTAKLSS